MNDKPDEIDWIHRAALGAYRQINPDGPAFSTIPQSEQNRWRDAYGVARQITPIVVQIPVAADLTETSFDLALSILGHPPPELTVIYGGPWRRFEAHRIAASRGCRFIELPEGALKTRFAWVLRTSDGAVFSTPTD